MIFGYANEDPYQLWTIAFASFFFFLKKF